MSYVPQIIINGVLLSRAEAVTVQVAVTDLQMSEPSGEGAISEAIAASYRANASSVLKIMLKGQEQTSARPEHDVTHEPPTRPMSRAEEHILSLAGRSIGYAPSKGGPWWKFIAPWHATRLRRRLEAEGLIVADKRPDGRAAFFRVMK